MNQTEIINAAVYFLDEKATLISDSQTEYPRPFYVQKFKEALDELFCQTHWDFAQAATKLNLADKLPSTLMNFYEYAYVRPQNVGLIRTVDKKEIIEMILFSKKEIEVKDFREVDDGKGGIIILSNIEDACCLYTNKLTNPYLYPGDFCNALIYGTAVKLAPRLNKEMLTSAIQMYNYYLGVAVENTLNKQKDMVGQKKESKYMRRRRVVY